MFERFSDAARRAVVLAQDEARRFRHGYVGTEHLLLGLVREEEAVAARVLESVDVTLEEVRAQVDRIIGRGENVEAGELAFTPRAKKVFDLALREALGRGRDEIDTEDLLLALMREGEGVAARILLDFDVDERTIRTAVVRKLTSGVRRRTEADNILVEIPGAEPPRALGPFPVALASLGFPLGLLVGWVIWGRRARN